MNQTVSLNWQTSQGIEIPAERQIGTIGQLIGKGGKIKLIKSNLVNTEKRVVLILVRADGQEAMVICSKGLSALIRAKAQKVSQMRPLMVVAGTNGGFFVSAGQGTIDVAQDETITESKFEPSELIDF